MQDVRLAVQADLVGEGPSCVNFETARGVVLKAIIRGTCRKLVKLSVAERLRRLSTTRSSSRKTVQLSGQLRISSVEEVI